MQSRTYPLSVYFRLIDPSVCRIRCRISLFVFWKREIHLSDRIRLMTWDDITERRTRGFRSIFRTTASRVRPMHVALSRLDWWRKRRFLPKQKSRTAHPAAFIAEDRWGFSRCTPVFHFHRDGTADVPSPIAGTFSRWEADRGAQQRKPMLFLSCIKEKRRSAGNRNTSGSSVVIGQDFLGSWSVSRWRPALSPPRISRHRITRTGRIDAHYQTLAKGRYHSRADNMRYSVSQSFRILQLFQLILYVFVSHSKFFFVIFAKKCLELYYISN